MEISSDVILFIRGEITRRSPVLMGACNSPVVADSVGGAIFAKFKKSPQAMSYVIPLLREEGFCRVSDPKPFMIHRLPGEQYVTSEEPQARGKSSAPAGRRLDRTGEEAMRAADLAMTSAILRFRNASVFQIIDRHAYRAVYGSGYPRSSSPDKKVSIYFQYLDDLLTLCSAKALQSETIDRVLYIFDKKFNGKL